MSMDEWANMIYNWKVPDFICITHYISKDFLKIFIYFTYVSLLSYSPVFSKAESLPLLPRDSMIYQDSLDVHYKCNKSITGS